MKIILTCIEAAAAAVTAEEQTEMTPAVFGSNADFTEFISAETSISPRSRKNEGSIAVSCLPASPKKAAKRKFQSVSADAAASGESEMPSGSRRRSISGSPPKNSR